MSQRSRKGRSKSKPAAIASENRRSGAPRGETLGRRKRSGGGEASAKSGFGEGVFGKTKPPVDSDDRPIATGQPRSRHAGDAGPSSARNTDMPDVPYPAGLPTDRPLEVDDYFDQLQVWLDLEAEAERARLAMRRQLRSEADVERSGEAIVGLDLNDYHTGLAGRYLLDFSKPGGNPLPMSRLKVGSPVVVSLDDDPSDEGIAGVVSRRKNQTIQVATETFPDRPTKTSAKKRGVGSHGKSNQKNATSVRYRLDLSPDETTRRRQLAAMAEARLLRGKTARMRDVLLGQQGPRFDGRSIQQQPVDDATVREILSEIKFLTELNPPQREAVAFALLADDVAILHGPPGTGKTTTLTEIVAQAVLRGDRVLACAASNTAVDNLLERLANLVPYVVRVGHPARVTESLRDHTLDALVENDPSSGVIRDLRRELDQVLHDAMRTSRDRDDRRRRGRLFAEAGQLRGQIRSLEKSIVRGVLDRADVICTTTTIDEELLGDERFDLVVIDEACQSTEPGVWQAILRAQRVILAGDHCQLPPTVLSDRAAAIGMRESLMQRLVEHYGDAIYRRLTVQYRMHESIMRFSSDWFYQGSLIADASVRRHRLCDLRNVERSPLTESTLLWIDTAGAGYEEQLEKDGQSKWNPGEAGVVLRLLRDLDDHGVRGDQIAVIAPYAAQVRYLRGQADLDGLEIDTVDGFQGREKEVVLLSMVRSNPDGQIGFLADRRRSNVAMTRARRQLIVLGDSATLGGNEFYAAVLDYFESAAAYQSVYQWID